MLKLYRNIPIKYKLILVFNVFMIVCMAVLSYINYKNSESSLAKKSTLYVQDILKMTEIRLNDYVQNLNLLSENLLPDDRVILSINDYNSPDSLEIYQEAFTIENLLKKALFSHDEIQSIAIISNKGNYHPADKNNRNISIKNIVPYKSLLYNGIVIAAREKSGSPIFYLDSREGRTENLFMARMIYSIDNLQEMGVMIVLLDNKYLNDLFRDLINEDMQNIVILSSDNRVIADRNSALTAGMQKYFARMSDLKGWFQDDSSENIISYLVMDRFPGWKVLSSVSLKSLYQDIDALRQQIILSSIMIVLILSILSLLMTADFIKPFKKLISGMERVRNGDRDVTITLDRKDEIGYLGEAFNRMVKELRNLSTWAYEEQLTRKEAEIKALQSQINPHFLFNTLESINWMAQLNRVPEISEMVTALSSLMEASIGRDDKLITLREELYYIDNYFIIMKKRFEDRIDFVKKIDEKALDIRIPRLLIQPLIENAIHHGIEFNRAKGKIRLNALVDSPNIVISVEDDGEGISPEELEIINETLSMDNESYFKRVRTGKSRSIGLDNVNRRIKLFYGEDYGLAIDSVKNSYTKVTVAIPAVCPENAQVMRKTV